MFNLNARVKVLLLITKLSTVFEGFDDETMRLTAFSRMLLHHGGGPSRDGRHLLHIGEPTEIRRSSHKRLIEGPCVDPTSKPLPAAEHTGNTMDLESSGMHHFERGHWRSAGAQ